MEYPTIGEVLVLWHILIIIIGFFIGFKKVFFLNTMIFLIVVGFIVAGFFIGIGNHAFEIYLQSL